MYKHTYKLPLYIDLRRQTIPFCLKVFYSEMTEMRNLNRFCFRSPAASRSPTAGKEVMSLSGFASTTAAGKSENGYVSHANTTGGANLAIEI